MSDIKHICTRRVFSAGMAAFAALPVSGAAKGRSHNEGILFNIWKGATKDGPGIRTVVALKGCPLRCMWCHSPESWSFAIEKYPNGEIIGWKTTPQKVIEEVLRDKAFYDASGGGITLSGGEALAQLSFSRELLRLSKKAGIHTAIETSGYAPASTIKDVLPYVDLWLYDIKHLDSEICQRLTKRPLAPVLRNLRFINDCKGRIVLRCPMVPGINDDEAELSALAKLADSLGCVEALDVLPYVPYGVDKAHRLGLKVYEAPIPSKEYGPGIVAKLSSMTGKTVRMP